eukprot:8843968-Alexandrium_andersonii.AAC.1
METRRPLAHPSRDTSSGTAGRQQTPNIQHQALQLLERRIIHYKSLLGGCRANRGNRAANG